MRTRLLLSLLTLLAWSILPAQALPLSRSADSTRDHHQSDQDSSILTRSSRDTSKSELSIDDDLFEGDIKLQSGQDPYYDLGQSIKTKRETSVIMPEESGSGESVTTLSPETYETKDNLWDGGKVLYKYDGEITPMYRTIIEEAMDWWKDVSCITFEEAQETEEDFVLFRKVGEGFGCSSYVGRKGGEQWLNISESCNGVGSVAHEIGHALGMWHEHSRPDRDNYIKINLNNVFEGQEKNFGKISHAVFRKVPSVSYDIESIMHYGPYAFEKSQGKATIEVLENATWDMCDDPKEMGQRQRLSYKDVLRVKLLYKCGGVTANDMPTDCSTTIPSMPDPTKTKITPSPSPSPTVRQLESEDTISIRSFNGNEGMRCVTNPGCTPTPCFSSDLFSISHCDNVQNQFKIIKVANISVRGITNGDTVALRSVEKPSTWLNCSGQKTCKITKCTDNEFNSNVSVTNCAEHAFIIKGVTINKKTGATKKIRDNGKVVSTRFFIQLQSVTERSFLNCSGKRCKLLDEAQNFNVTYHEP